MIYFAYVLQGAAVYVAAQGNAIGHNDLGAAGYVGAVVGPVVEADGTLEDVYRSTGISNLRAKELTQLVMIAEQAGHV